MNDMNVAFDQLFANFLGFDRHSKSSLNHQTSTFPPHDVIKINNDEYMVQLAVAGYSKEELDVVVENDKLYVVGHVAKTSQSTDIYLHKGIAKRAFKLNWILDKFVEVESVSLKNGLLQVKLKRVVLEVNKPKHLSILD